jgi:hypothetical protein
MLVRRGLFLGVVVGAMVLGTMSSQAAGADPKKVQGAIDLAKQYLYSLQKNGNWELSPTPDVTETAGYSVKNGQYGGLTAIATYALLAAGDDPQSDRLKAAIAFLKRVHIRGIYAMGLRAQVWNSIPMDPGVREAIRDDRNALLQAVCNKGSAVGFYGYCTDTPKDKADKSVSQFAVLGLWALNQAGAEMPSNCWQLFEDRWSQQQFSDGSWCYDMADTPGEGNSSPTVSMTAAGVATLFITQDYTHMTPQSNGNVDNKRIDAGMVWLGTHFKGIDPGRYYYTLFGISRVGLASGYKYIGNTNWFEFGVDALLQRQAANGSWDCGRDNTNKIPDTCFGLLFLSRGRAPVMMNKLEYEVTEGGKKVVPGMWNQRPRDVANLTRMVGQQLESPQSWQIVNLSQGLRDLHDAPILYMAGSTAPKLTPTDQDHLKQFIEEGGLVLGHADTGSAAFAGGFRRLGENMFPGRTFAQLPADHPIYTAQNFPRSRWKTKPVVEGLDNGDRELMLLLPTGDPAKSWQADAFPNIKSDVYGQLMIDILLYAEDEQGLREKGETYMVARRDDVKAATTIRLARLKYNGNWDPEPGGWRRLVNIMHNDRHIDLDPEVVELGSGKLDASYQAAELTVGGTISLTESQRSELRDYVSKGGTLVVDVAGGMGLYKSAVEVELAQIFPETSKQGLSVLPLTSPIYKAGQPITAVSYRHSARAVLGSLHAPRLRGLDRNGRTALIYSPEDIVTGLVGEQVGGIVGYAPDSASPLMANILTYAAKH